MGVVIFVTMRYEKMGVGESKCGALRNANEKIENALIDIAIPEYEWGYRCFDVFQWLKQKPHQPKSQRISLINTKPQII